MGRKEADTGRQFETNVRLQLTVHVMLMSVALHQKLSPCESHVRKNTNGRSEGDIGYSHSLKIRINIFIKKITCMLVNEDSTQYQVCGIVTTRCPPDG